MKLHLWQPIISKFSRKAYPLTPLVGLALQASLQTVFYALLAPCEKHYLQPWNQVLAANLHPLTPMAAAATYSLFSSKAVGWKPNYSNRNFQPENVSAVLILTVSVPENRRNYLAY